MQGGGGLGRGRDPRGRSVVATVLLVAAALASDVLLVHGRVWDGSGAPAAPADVWVHDDRVQAVGVDLAAPPEATVLDATGATVLPGLIDAHVHLSMDPGAGWRHDDDATHTAQVRAHLAAYLACGVTTILDPAVLPAEEARIRRLLAGGAPGPRYLSLGAPFSPPDGYVAAVIPGFPTVANRTEVEAQLDGLLRHGDVGAKVTVERGFLVDRYPLHTPEVFGAIRVGAMARNLPIYAHALSPDEQSIALDRLHPRAMVHAMERPDARLVRRLRAAGTYTITTLAIADAFAGATDLGRLADPFLDTRVPAAELATARDPQVAQGFSAALVHEMLPGFPRWVVGPAFLRAALRSHLSEANAAIRALRSGGVPLVLGSDAGNWPLIPYLFHGPSTLRELELLYAAGLTPAEALTAGTRTAAEMLELPIGRITAGAPADLVVVEGDPLSDLRAMRAVRWTVRSGEARTPAGWMGE